MNETLEQDGEQTPVRLASIDAYRGLVMFLMMAEVLEISRVARSFPDSPVWQFLSFHTSHVAWTGGSLHDMIQPSFSFLVGVALPFSLANRQARGQSFGRMFLHALWRSLLLIFLGIFLRSIGRSQTNFIFTDTLTQIGLGYPFLFLLGYCSRLVQAIVLLVILGGYWGAFVWYPLPPADFSYATVGVPVDWPYYFSGFEAHWNKNSNLAWAFDQWFLNLFPREQPFVYNPGGYATLSFIPTLGTMLLGLIGGGWLKSDGSHLEKLTLLVVAGLLCLGVGFGLDIAGLGPIVKRIWTPSWVLYSGGWCFLLLALFYLLVDVAGLRPLVFPLIVIGMNSIAIYCMVTLFKNFILSSFRTHLGPDAFKGLGEEYETLLAGAAVMLVFWLILFWMYRRKIFLRI